MESPFKRDVSRLQNKPEPSGIKFFGGKRNILHKIQYAEQCRIYGLDALYYPITYNNVDRVLGDVLYAQYEENKVLKLKLKPVKPEGYEGNEFFAATGNKVKHKYKVDIVKDTFKCEAMEQKSLDIIPKPGDLIRFDVNDDLFEVKFVDPEVVFYDHGDAFVYRLSISKFIYSGEQMETGIEDVDVLNDLEASENPDALEDKMGDNLLMDKIVLSEDDPIIEEDFLSDY